MSEVQVPAVPVHTIVFHQSPLHPDELFIDWLRSHFPVAEERYPGISQAKIENWGLGGRTPDGRPAEEWEKEGVLAFGTGGGRFDEHGTFGRERKRGECSASLFAKDLGLDQDPALRRILQYIKANDLDGKQEAEDVEAGLARIVNRAYYAARKHNLGDEATILGQARWIFTSWYLEQCDSLEAVEEFNQKAMVEEVNIGRGKIAKMATIVSDNELIHKIVSRKQCGQVGIVIAKRSTGHVQIFTNHLAPVELRNAVILLRKYEREAERQPGSITKWLELEREGSLAGVGYEKWYFHARMMILNGSATASDVPPTLLALEKIQEIVRFGIYTDYLQPGRACVTQGVCDHSDANPCPVYQYGLVQCRWIRGETRKRSRQVLDSALPVVGQKDDD